MTRTTLDSSKIDDLNLFNAPFVRSPYNYDVMVASDASGLACEDPSLTQQQFMQESDINWIVDNFVRNPEDIARGYKSVAGVVADFTDLPTNYHELCNIVRTADANFMRLPARVRSRFDNDVGKMIEFLSDGANLKEAIELGLIPGEEGASADAPLSQQAGGASSGRPGKPAGAKPSGKGSVKPPEGEDGGSGEA